MEIDETIDRLRAICLGFPDASERLSHGEPAWFIQGKRTFATLANHHHDDRFAFWCAGPPGAQQALIESDPTRFFYPPYVGYRGWIGVWLDVEIVWDDVAEIVEDAYRAIAPKKLLAILDAE